MEEVQKVAYLVDPEEVYYKGYNVFEIDHRQDSLCTVTVETCWVQVLDLHQVLELDCNLVVECKTAVLDPECMVAVNCTAAGHKLAADHTADLHREKRNCIKINFISKNSFLMGLTHHLHKFLHFYSILQINIDILK